MLAPGKMENCLRTFCDNLSCLDSIDRRMDHFTVTDVDVIDVIVKKLLVCHRTGEFDDDMPCEENDKALKNERYGDIRHNAFAQSFIGPGVPASALNMISSHVGIICISPDGSSNRPKGKIVKRSVHTVSTDPTAFSITGLTETLRQCLEDSGPQKLREGYYSFLDIVRDESYSIEHLKGMSLENFLKDPKKYPFTYAGYLPYGKYDDLSWY